jgi:hypothetical protein
MQVAKYLKILMDADVPQQCAPFTGLPTIQEMAEQLGLPSPSLYAGNIVLGDLGTCDFLLTAHMDEVCFGFTKIDDGGGWISAYHNFVPSNEKQTLTIVGVRNKEIKVIGQGELIQRDNKLFCQTDSTLMLGDRAVYHYPAVIAGDLVTGKAIDDRAGVLTVLLAANELFEKGISVAVVLSDGEEQMPNGYFSRNFPQVLPLLKDSCKIVYVDGIYREGLEPDGFTGPPKSALVVPHSSHGKGYLVPPLTFARLRDEVIPGAQKQGIDVEVCSAYLGRGDEWGMVTNPTTGKDFECFFVSFGAWGSGHNTPNTVDVRCIENCIKFIAFAAEQYAPSSPTTKQK